jgi:CheY-like chemotaxis protein
MATVLIIDDDRHVRTFIKTVLSADGHTVHEALDGRAGLNVLMATKPDVVVCDLFMPGMEGIETIREMRRLAPAVPVVAVSGGGQWGVLDALEWATDFGAVVALPKPLSFELLRRVVNELASGRPVSVDARSTFADAAAPPVQGLVGRG